MADSITERILQAVIAALDGPGKPNGTKVDRSRRLPVDARELPRISLERLDEGVTPATGTRTSQLRDRRLRVAVVSRVAGPDEDLDAFSQWAITALEADPSLGGLALGIEEQAVDWEKDEKDARFDYSAEARIFEIRYATRRDDLTQ